MRERLIAAYKKLYAAGKITAEKIPESIRNEVIE